jgi:hypothetical protein
MNSSNRSQLQQFLTAFQAHTELRRREQQALLCRQNAMQLEIDDLKMQLQLAALHPTAVPSAHAHSVMTAIPSAASAAMHSDAAPGSAEQQSSEDLDSLRSRDEEQRLFRAEMEDRLRSALLVEEEAKLARDVAMEQVALLQQQLQDVMREVRLQHERRDATRTLPLSPTHVDVAVGAAASARAVEPPERVAAAPLSPKHMCRPPPCPIIFRRFGSRGRSPSAPPPAARQTPCSQSFWKWAMSRSKRRCAPLPPSIASYLTCSQDAIAVMSAQGGVPTLDAVVERLLNA